MIIINLSKKSYKLNQRNRIKEIILNKAKKEIGVESNLYKQFEYMFKKLFTTR